MAEQQEDLNLLSDLLNPVSNLKLEFVSPLSIFTYRSMKNKGNLMIQPFYFLDLVPGVKKFGSNINLRSMMKEPTLKKFGQSGLGLITGKWGWNIEDSLGEMLPEKGAASIMAKRIQDYTKKNNIIKHEEFISFLKKGSEKETAFVTSNEAALVKLANRTKTLMKIGSIGQGVMTTYWAGRLIADLSIGFFKGAVASANYINAAKQSVRDLEFGKVTSGFMSQGAATERQVALQEMQNSHLNGSLFLTNEAKNYAGII